MRRNKTNSVRRFERLEERQMMAADIDLNNGILTIQGTDNGDNIQVAIDPNDSDRLLVKIADDLTGALLRQGAFDVDDVDKIVVNGLGGNDEMYNYTDIRADMFGGSGIDFITSGGGNDLIDGGSGDDRITGGRGNDKLIGGIGNDTYIFWDLQLGSDTIVEDASLDADTLDFTFLSGPIHVNLASTSLQTVNAGNLTLQLSSSTGIENVFGTFFADTIRGNARNNDLRGALGNDSLFGEAGDDDLFGSGGNDSLYGGIGNDELFGSSGNDWLYGEAGLDTLDGGADNDFLDGGRDGYVDRLTGGSGADTFVKYKKRTSPFFDYEQKVTDYNSAVDAVLTVWY
jgi:Ca2+-binding RTX toxin-like protein